MATTSLLRYAQAAGRKFGFTVTAGGPADDFLVSLDGWVYISACEIPTVYHDPEQVPGYEVSYDPGFPPEDWEVVTEGKYQWRWDAVHAAAMLVLGKRLGYVLAECETDMWLEEQS